MADEKVTKEEAKKTDESGEKARNKGRGVEDYDEKNPNPDDIHSDDPMVAGLANGQRQSEGKDDVGPVK